MSNVERRFWKEKPVLISSMKKLICGGKSTIVGVAKLPIYEYDCHQQIKRSLVKEICCETETVLGVNVGDRHYEVCALRNTEVTSKYREAGVEHCVTIWEDESVRWVHPGQRIHEIILCGLEDIS